jgi:hypothetical protein
VDYKTTDYESRFKVYFGKRFILVRGKDSRTVANRIIGVGD